MDHSTHHKHSSTPGLLWGNRQSLTICVAVLILNVISFLPFYTDDALISLQYAKRLLEGYGLSWTTGERVEGYSNLLWVLITASFGSFGFDLVEGSRLLGAFFTFTALIAIFAIPGTKPRAMWIGGLVFALYGPVGAWAIGGLEQPLLVALVAWASVYASRYTSDTKRYDYLWRAGLLLGLATVTRSDGILFAAAVVLAILEIRREQGTSTIARELTTLASLPVLFFVGQTLFRYWYYGEWVSNIAYLKLALSLDRIWYGFRYVVRGYALLFPFSLVVFGIIGAYWKRDSHGIVRICGTQLILWSVYLIFIGGDVNPPSRHFVPVAGLSGLLLVVGCSYYFDDCVQRGIKFPYGFTALCFFIFTFIQLFDAENIWARRTRGVQSCREVSELMRRHFLTFDPLLAVDSAGCYPYWSDLRSLDLLGLNDYVIARTPSADFGSGWIGHEAGNGSYVFDRQADILAFCGYAGADKACWRSGKEMQADPRFLREYKLARFNIANLDTIEARLWLRLAGPLGVIGDDLTRIVPAYLLDENDWPVLVEESGTSFQFTIGEGKSYRIAPSLLEPGVWKVSVHGDSGFCVRYRDKSIAANGEALLEIPDKSEPIFIQRCIGADESGDLQHVRLTRYN